MKRGRSHCVRRTHLEAREGSTFGGLRQSTVQVDPGSDVVFATSHQHPAVFEDGVSVVKRKSAGSAVKVSVKYRLHRCRHCIDTKGRGVGKVFPRGCVIFSAIGRDRGSAGEEPQAAKTLVTVNQSLDGPLK